MSKNSVDNRGCGLSVVMLWLVDGLSSWFRSAREVDTLGFLNRHPESLHATVVNCTPPNARSVASEKELLQLVEPLLPKMLRRMPAVVEGQDPFELALREPLVTGGKVILPSVPHPRIFDLKARLQGDHRSIPEKDVPAVLALEDCLGVDKFSTESPGENSLLRPSVAITLGETKTHDVDKVRTILKSLPPVPAVWVTGIRLALYRDRRLDDVSVSASLNFGASRQTVEKIIFEFFKAVVPS